mgnify:CR=1 FL=1
MTAAPLLEVEGLALRVAGLHGRALLDDVSFGVGPGEVLGIVGESGSGKTLTAFAIAGLLPDTVTVAGGLARLGDVDLLALDPARRRRLAGDRIGFVFQDPMSSFNPVRTIGSLLVESARRHRGLGAGDARDRAVRALTDVKLPDPERLVDAYPHELSGGQRQRAILALALLNDPALLIADEPTTALDATVQMHVLQLLRSRSAGRATILITHDLGVAASICDRILVLYRGRCMETGLARELLARPRHPYTRMLLDAVPSLSHPEREFRLRHGPAATRAAADGCPYAPRCERAIDRCATRPDWSLAPAALACWNPEPPP